LTLTIGVDIFSAVASLSGSANVRVAILGNSGSGKSTLSHWLAQAGAARALDLDTIAWEADKPTTLKAERVAQDEVHAFCNSHENWVVEGCYANLIESALSYSPCLILLNPGEEACLANCRARPWEPHKYASRAEQDANLPFLLSWVSEYYVRSGPLSLAAHQTCFGAYCGPKRELTSLPDRQLALDIARFLHQSPPS
jgi:adenylate kinase family enzyme